MRDRRVVLGPCPCSNCRKPLYWDGWEWKNWTNPGSGDDHSCTLAERVRVGSRYTSGTEYSGPDSYHAQRPLPGCTPGEGPLPSGRTG